MELATLSLGRRCFSLRLERAWWWRGRAGAGKGGGGCCVSAARVLALGARPASQPAPGGPPRGCKDDRRGGGGGRALSGTCRSPRYGAARALAPCLSAATKVAAGVWPAGPGPRCRAARWVSGERCSGERRVPGWLLPECSVVRAARWTPGFPALLALSPEPGARRPAAPWLCARRSRAGGVAVTGPGLGAGTFASVYQNLRFDVRCLSGLTS